MKYSFVLLSLVGAAVAYAPAPIAEEPVAPPPVEVEEDVPAEAEPGTSISIGEMLAKAVGLNSVSVGATEDEAAGAASGENMAMAAAAITPGFAFGFAN